MQHHDPFRTHAARDRYSVPQLGAADVLAAPRKPGPLRVLAHVDRYPPHVNAGGEWMLHDLLTPLAEAGHDVHVTTNTQARYDYDGVTVWPAQHAGDRARDADVIVGHLMWTRGAVQLAADHRRPLVYLAHNHRQLRHWSLTPANVTVLVVNSRWLARDIETPRRRGLPSSQAHGVATWDGPSMIVRPPVRLADYHLDRDPADADRYTLVNGTEAKGVGTLYWLARRPPARRWLLVEGGYGVQVPVPAQAPIELQPQTANIRDDVYARTRVLLMPSHYESWGRVAVEALCSGIPVVASPTPGLREALGDAALFCEPDAYQDWQAALALLDDPTVYAEASAAARARAVELDRMAEADLARWELTLRAAAATTS